jgi:predicted ATPase
MAGESEIVGREQELAAIDAFLDAPPGGPAALLVEGEAGIGKTTLWLAAVQAARMRGQQVLDAVPAEAERDLPFSALGDLLGGVIGSIIEVLRGPEVAGQWARHGRGKRAPLISSTPADAAPFFRP